MTKLISVVIPAYNHEKYIQETIQSVIDQTYRNIELIVIDDGSKDRTWYKLVEMRDVCEKRFSRIDFERQENNGTSFTLNRLFSKAQGEFIALLASDDCFLPDAINVLQKQLDSSIDYGLAVGDNMFIDEDSKEIFWDDNQNSVSDINLARFKTFGKYLQFIRQDVNFKSKKFGSYFSLLKCNYIPNGYLIRRDIFEKNILFNFNAPLEDWYMMLQISKVSSMKYIDQVLFKYRWHSRNTVKDHEKMREISLQTIQCEISNINADKSSKFRKEVNMFFELPGVTVKTSNFKIGNKIFEFYVLKNSGQFFHKQYVMKLFGKEIMRYERK